MGVYVINAVGTDFYKIGVADVNLKKRISQIQTGCPYELCVVSFFEDESYPFEYRIHEVYKEYRHRGEWFKIPPEIIKQEFQVGVKIKNVVDDINEVYYLQDRIKELEYTLYELEEKIASHENYVINDFWETVSSREGRIENLCHIIEKEKDQNNSLICLKYFTKYIDEQSRKHMVHPKSFGSLVDRKHRWVFDEVFSDFKKSSYFKKFENERIASSFPFNVDVIKFIMYEFRHIEIHDKTYLLSSDYYSYEHFSSLFSDTEHYPLSEIQLSLRDSLTNSHVIKKAIESKRNKLIASLAFSKDRKTDKFYPDRPNPLKEETVKTPTTSTLSVDRSTISGLVSDFFVTGKEVLTRSRLMHMDDNSVPAEYHKFEEQYGVDYRTLTKMVHELGNEETIGILEEKLENVG